MIISRTPFRTSFLGGGTDLPYFYQEHGGAVISIAINRYSYLAMHRGFHDKGFLLKYSKTEDVQNVDDIEHRIIRAVFKDYGIDGVDFSSAADIPAGTGLGSSSAFACGMVALCDAYTGITRQQLDIAESACDIELNKLEEPIGKQDQYGCAVGGLKLIEFHQDDSVSVNPILLDTQQQNRLKDSLILVYCGGTRSASAQLVEQKNNAVSSKKLIENLKIMASQAYDLSKNMLSDIDCLGDYLHEGWERKQRLSSSISNPDIDSLYKRALAAGAKGGKLLGAGGSGFLLLHATPDNMDSVIDALSGEKIERIAIDMQGTQIVYNDLI